MLTSLLVALMTRHRDTGVSRSEECAGWRNGTRGTWTDQQDKRHRSSPGGFTSQQGQDRLLWNAIFSNYQRPGVYADVASNHYKRISNTYFYDVCAGWRGVCVEPNSIYWDQTRAHRSCQLVNTCASDTRALVELVLPNCSRCSWLGGMGGIANGSLLPLLFHMNGSQVARRRSRASLWSWYPPAKWNRVSKRCTLLGDEFARLGHSHVDLLSLDVEGHEAAVLRGINWSATQIDYILCEAHCDSELRPRGYVPVVLPPATNSSPPRTTTERLWTRPGLVPPFRRPPRLGGRPHTDPGRLGPRTDVWPHTRRALPKDSQVRFGRWGKNDGGVGT